jgi:hypothetical protein
MIVEAMTLLLGQLNDYVAQADGSVGTPAQAVWGNIAQLDRTEVATELDNHLVLSLVNLEEERALKNGRTAAILGAGDVGYMNRPYHLNLFLLFTANYRDYGTALRRLAQVLTFFQGKQKFTFANSPGPNPPLGGIVDFSLAMDLLSLSFEEVNHLWDPWLEQSPSAIFRGRLVVVSDQRVLETGAESGNSISPREASAHDSLPACLTSTSRTILPEPRDVVLEAQTDVDRAAIANCILSAPFSRCSRRRHRRCLPGARCSSGPRRRVQRRRGSIRQRATPGRWFRPTISN